MKHKLSLSSSVLVLLVAVGTFGSLPSERVETNLNQFDNGNQISLKEANKTNNVIELKDVDCSSTINGSNTTSTSQSYSVTISSQISTYKTKQGFYFQVVDSSYSPNSSDWASDEDGDGIGDSVFDSIVYKINSTSSSDIIIPEYVTYGNSFKLRITGISSNAVESYENINSISIPSSIATIGEDAFKNCNVPIYCEDSSKQDGWSSSWTDGSNISWGAKFVVPTNIKINGTTAFGSGKNFIIGYIGPNKEDYYPLEINYSVTHKDKTTEDICLELPLDSSNNNNYDGVGNDVGSTSFSKNIDINLEIGDVIDDESIYFTNIYSATKNSSSKYIPDLSQEYSIKPRISYSGKYDISDFAKVSFDSITTYAGYTTVTTHFTLVDGIYERVKESVYNSYKSKIEDGSVYIRYRLTSLNLSKYKISYKSGNEVITKTANIVTPKSSHVLSTGDSNEVCFLVENSAIDSSFSAKSIESFSLLGLYLTIDIFSVANSKAISKSAVSTRFSSLSLFSSSDLNTVKDINSLLIWTVIIYSIVFVLLTIGYFIYKKNVFKNDEFRRLKPKSFVKNAIIAFFGIGTIMLAILYIVVRATSFNNSVVVYNPTDAYIIGFVVASILFIGYYVKYFITLGKAYIEKKKNDKLKLNDAVDDDGTGTK